MTEQPKLREQKRQQTIGTYNQSADALAAKFDSLGARIPDIEETFALVKKENPKVLEIGSGNGRDAAEILKHTKDYIGVDISTELVKCAQAKNPEGKFQVADITSFNLPKDIDIVFAFASLIHLDKEELRGVLKKIHENLTASGVVRISMKYSDEYAEITTTDEFGTRTYYHYSDKEVIKLAAGFSALKDTIVERGSQKWIELILQKVQN